MTLPFCSHHPGIEASANCARCGQPFCDACLVEILGQRFCAPCRDVRLAEMQAPLRLQGAPVFAGTGKVDIGRWLGGGWQIIQTDLLTFAVATLLATIFSVLSCYLLAIVMWCGLTMMCYRKLTTGYVEVGHLFDGFRRTGWGIVAVLFAAVVAGLMYAAMFGATFGLQWVGMRQNNPILPLLGSLAGNGVSMVLGFLLAGLVFFIVPHIAARNVNPVEAFQASWEVCRRNYLMFCLTGWLFNLLAGLGVWALCIGWFVSVPWVVAATAYAYADHFGIQGWDQV